MNRKCIFAGSFDPVTLGHEYLIAQSLKMFDEVVVAILVNPVKTPAFSIEQRMEMLRIALNGEKRIRIVEWKGTVAELLKKENTPFYIIQSCPGV